MPNWRDRARDLRREVTALAIAGRDPRTPWYSKVIVLVTVGLAVSPIDPIPDFIPILGYADDVVFIPLGVYLARRGIPDDVMADARQQSKDRETEDGVVGWLTAVSILLFWVVIGVLLWYFLA
ncbi:hypothetical protein A4G99_13775 [Haladaptatus sp. R4]|uniref:YkvA family protein n=1 Tax=Haladaptatus sp. R4 TaxID=1679489 RepID=UPI0007B4F547|nr:YkvA family protein [Haladaptatus sp. R4]KZN23897.1 hypothetical protein A4G99_13775 [Haladaptatus sp. R4]